MAGYKILFESSSGSIGSEAFVVTEVTGHDWMSRPYRFDIELVSLDANLDLTEVLKNPAKLVIKQGYEEGENRLLRNLNYFGMVATATQTGRKAQWYSYRVTLVPELMKLARIKRSRVFQGKSPLKVIEEILKEYSLEYEMKNLSGAFNESGDVESKDFFILQYNETDLDFISRWLEHEGIYYYWIQDDGAGKEKLCFGNTAAAYGTIPGLTEPYKYDPQQEAGAESRSDAEAMPNIALGLAETEILSPTPLKSHEASLNSNWYAAEVIREFNLHHRLLPKQVVLRDYNYEEGTEALEATAPVDSSSVGDVYELDYHFKDQSRGDYLAKARAESIKARKTRMAGVSDARGFRAGGLIKMFDHFKTDLNSGSGAEVEFLLTYVQHRLKQEPAASGGAASSVEYGNSFEAVPAKDVIFGPDRLTMWPKVAGNMTATIEEAEGGDYSNVDTQGRYLVKLPLDLRTGAGPSSCRVRRSEPFGGNGHGLHFPSLPGDEVMLSFVNGDPDRPVISGSVSNTSNSNVVNDAGPSVNRIQTPGGSVIEMDDTRGTQAIMIQTRPGGSATANLTLDGTDGSEVATLSVPGESIVVDGASDSVTMTSTGKSKSFIRLGADAGEANMPSSKAGASIASLGNVSAADGIFMYTDGDVNRYVGGAVSEQIMGNDETLIEFDAQTEIRGKQTNVTFGPVFDHRFNNELSTVIGVSEEFYLGLKMDTFVGFATDISLSGTLEVTKSKKLSVGSESEYEINSKKIVNKSMLDQEMTSGLGNVKVEAVVGNVEVSSGAGKVEISAPCGITLKCGSHQICIGPMGIKIQSGGTRFTMNGTSAKLTSAKIDIKATGMLSCKGTPGGMYK